MASTPPNAVGAALGSRPCPMLGARQNSRCSSDEDVTREVNVILAQVPAIDEVQVTNDPARVFRFTKQAGQWLWPL